MKVDEFVEKKIEESRKELEDYRRLMFIDILPYTSINKRTISIKPSIATELQQVQIES